MEPPKEELPAQPTPQEPVVPVEPKRARNWPKLILATLVLLLLAAGGVFAALRLRNNNQPETASTPKQDVSVFTFGTAEGPINTFYPTHGTTATELELNQQIFEGLVRFDNRTKIVPLLASSWTNPDSSTWIFELKPNVKFHTGRTLTATDVKASLDAIKETDLGELYAATIKEVSVVDDSHVKIITDGPDAILLNKLTFLHIFDSTSELKNDPANGTGPYQVKAGTTPSETELSLTAFDDYHGGRASTRELNYRLYEDQATLAKDLRDGKLNVAFPVNLEETDKLATEGYAPHPTSELSVFSLVPNIERDGSPLQNLKVREAIHTALDIPAFVQARKARGEAASQIVPEDIPGYDPSIKRPARDVAKAKKLLEEAGYKDGFTLEITYFAPAKAGIDELEKQLKEIGITVKHDSHDQVPTLVKKAFGGQSQMYFTSYATDLLDLIDVVTQIFLVSENYKNDRLNTLVEEANQTFDPAERLATLKEISGLLMDDLAWLPLYTPVQNAVFDKQKSYVFEKDLPGAGLGIYFWQLGAQ